MVALRSAAVRAAFRAAVLGVSLGMLSVAPAPATTIRQDFTFVTLDQSMWGTGGAAIFDFSHFLGAEWDETARTGNAQEGSNSTELRASTDGRIGLDFSFNFDSGSVDAVLPFSGGIELPRVSELVVNQPFTISTFGSLVGGSQPESARFTTNFPEVRIFADLILEAAASVGAEACYDIIVDSDCGGVDVDLLGKNGISESPELLAINRDGDGQLRLFDGFDFSFTNEEFIGSLVQAAEDEDGEPIKEPDKISVSVVFPTPPGVAEEALVTVGARLPDIETTGEVGGDGSTLSASGEDEFLDVNIDLDAIAFRTGLLPPLAFSESLDLGIGSANVSGSLLDVDLDPELVIEQDFDLETEIFVELTFDREVQAGIAGQVLGPTTSISVPVGTQIEVIWGGVDLGIEQDYRLEATLTNRTGLRIDSSISLEALEAEASFDVLGIELASRELGPVFDETLSGPSLSLPDVFDQTFALEGFNSFSGSPTAQPLRLATGTAEWGGSPAGEWETGANWEDDAQPGVGQDVLVSGPAPGGSDVTLNGDRVVGALTIGADDSLTVGGLGNPFTLTVEGEVLRNSGRLELRHGSDLVFDSPDPQVLAGSGQLDLFARLLPSGEVDDESVLYIHGSLASDNSIDAFGAAIVAGGADPGGPRLTNTATIEAFGDLRIEVGEMNNDGVLRSFDDLLIKDTLVYTLAPGAGGNPTASIGGPGRILLDNATIRGSIGGSLSTVIVPSFPDQTTATFETVDGFAPAKFEQGTTYIAGFLSTTNLVGDFIVNDGHLLFERFATLNIEPGPDDTLELRGDGTLTLHGPEAPVQVGLFASSAEALINGPAHTIEAGSASFFIDLVNRGTFDANVEGALANLNDVVNQGQLRASGGGALFMDDLENAEGTLEALGTSSVRVTDAKDAVGGVLAGGRWNALGDGAELWLEEHTVHSLAAEVALGGTAEFLTGGNSLVEGTPLDESLQSIEATGMLRLVDQHDFHALPDFSIEGRLELGNGAHFALADGAVNQADGVIVGNGMLSFYGGGLTNLGTIRAEDVGTSGRELIIEGHVDNTAGVVHSAIIEPGGNQGLVRLQGATIAGGQLLAQSSVRGFGSVEDADIYLFGSGIQADVAGETLSLDPGVDPALLTGFLIARNGGTLRLAGGDFIFDRPAELQLEALFGDVFFSTAPDLINVEVGSTLQLADAQLQGDFTPLAIQTGASLRGAGTLNRWQIDNDGEVLVEGLLHIIASPFDNESGMVRVAAGSVLELDGANIGGGTVESEGDGVVRLIVGGLSGGATNNAVVEVPTGGFGSLNSVDNTGGSVTVMEGAELLIRRDVTGGALTLMEGTDLRAEGVLAGVDFRNAGSAFVFDIAGIDIGPGNDELRLESMTVDNEGGTIGARSGFALVLDDATVEGGTVQTEASATLRGAGSLLGVDIDNQGKIDADAAAALEIDAAGDELANAGGLRASGAGGLELFDAMVVNAGAVEAAVGSRIMTADQYHQTAGSTLVDGELFANDVLIDGGLLGGSGMVHANVTIGPGGTLNGGSSPGDFAVDGNYTLAAGGFHVVEIAGIGTGEVDRLLISGVYDLLGTIIFDFIDGIALDVLETAFTIGDFFLFFDGANDPNATNPTPVVDFTLFDNATFLARLGFRQFAVDFDAASGGFSIGEEVAGAPAPGTLLLVAGGLIGWLFARQRVG